MTARLSERFFSKFKVGKRDIQTQWNNAQRAEAEWWRGLAKHGYAGLEAGPFIENEQRRLMLRALKFLGKPAQELQHKTVIEFGSGPAGVVEFIDAAKKIAVEPLIDEYRKEFPHLKISNVKYLACPAEGPLPLEDGIADLAICYNMLDHVYDPGKVIQELSRVCKDNADLLFQVNVYTTKEDLKTKTGLHAELHPHSFTPETAIAILEHHGFDVLKQICSSDINPCNEHYFICACRRQERSTQADLANLH